MSTTIEHDTKHDAVQDAAMQASFSCWTATDGVCDPYRCELCWEVFCAEEEHGDPDLVEIDRCYLTGALVHRECHRGCTSSACDPDQ